LIQIFLFLFQNASNDYYLDHNQTKIMPINRRQFLSTTTLAGGGLLLGQNKIKPLQFSIPSDFSITILATNWGFQGNVDDFCAKAKADGYDGIEVWLPAAADQQKALMDAVRKHDLAYGFLAGAGGNNFQKHLADFKKTVRAAVEQKPLFVNCHSGKDYFSFEENKQFIEFTLALEKSSGIPIYHETHRAKILFAAHITRDFLEAFPELQLTLDISHWCNVHSSLLQDQQKSVALALSRTQHIHSRVGFAQGPQVNDPRAPEWQKTVAAHFDWWDQVVERHSKAGTKLTMTTEFGPPDYMPTVPFTQQAITDLWTINSHMKDLWRTRYKG
jgi:sugar phosphate isomerase/epimerase